jgi:hypothetical protein
MPPKKKNTIAHLFAHHSDVTTMNAYVHASTYVQVSTSDLQLVPDEMFFKAQGKKLFIGICPKGNRICTLCNLCPETK